MADEALTDFKLLREEYSIDHYGKHENELTLDEMKELDCKYPCWTITKTGFPKIPLMEVSIGGTRVRDVITREEYHISYPEFKGNLSYPFIRAKVRDGSQTYRMVVHRLVARAFVPNDDPENRICVNHIDGNKANNWYKNLEWVTYKENTDHAIRTGLMKFKRGEEIPRHVYSEAEVRKVCETIMEHPNWTYPQISEVTGVSANTVKLIHNKKRWTHVTEDYDFPKKEKGFKYSEDQIRALCQLLEEYPEIRIEDASRLTGVSASMIRNIVSRNGWSEISKDYILPDISSRRTPGEYNNKAKYTNADAERVCQLLDDKYCNNINRTISEIAQICGVDTPFVERINIGMNWTHISKTHPFYQVKFGDRT